MSVNTQRNASKFPGYSPQVEATYFGTAAPTSTTGYNAGDEYWVTSDGTSTGTIKSVYRYDAILGQWVKYPSGGAVPILPALVPVLDILDTPPATPNDQDSYIVKATATGAWAGKEGAIATWSAVDNAWVFYEESNGLTQGAVTTVTTGTNIGTWSYDATLNEWVQTSTEITLPETYVLPSTGNTRMVTQTRIYRWNTGYHIVIQNDQVLAWGSGPMPTSAGDNTNSNNHPRKMPWVDSNLVANASAQVAGYVPKFVDAIVNNNNMLAIDHRGKLWWAGNSPSTCGATTTADGTTQQAQSPYALVPVAYFQNKPTLVVYRAYMSIDQTTTVFAAVLCTNGEVYVTGTNTNGQLGDGTTTNATVWKKYPITGVKDIKLATRTMFVRTISGDIYVSGYANTWQGTAANRTTPTLVISGAKDFDFGGTDATYLLVAKTDGTLWSGGANANGQLGKGNTTATTSITQIAGITNAAKVYANYYTGTNSAYITTGNTLLVCGNNTSGLFGLPAATVAVGANLTTFTAPTGSFQGTIASYYYTARGAYVLTSGGQVWSSGSATDRAMGSLHTGIATDATFWAQVALNSKVIDFRPYNDQVGQPGGIALVENHGIWAWGTAYKWNVDSTNFSRAIQHVQDWFENGIALTDPPKYIADVTGAITEASPYSVTDIVDGQPNQTVTFTFTVEAGTLGALDFTGSTFTAANVTQVSLTTTSATLSYIGQTISVSFVVNATDDPALNVGDPAQVQDWVLSLVVNGV